LIGIGYIVGGTTTTVTGTYEQREKNRITENPDGYHPIVSEVYSAFFTGFLFFRNRRYNNERFFLFTGK